MKEIFSNIKRHPKILLILIPALLCVSIWWISDNLTRILDKADLAMVDWAWK